MYAPILCCLLNLRPSICRHLRAFHNVLSAAVELLRRCFLSGSFSFLVYSLSVIFYPPLAPPFQGGEYIDLRSGSPSNGGLYISLMTHHYKNSIKKPCINQQNFMLLVLDFEDVSGCHVQSFSVNFCRIHRSNSRLSGLPDKGVPIARRPFLRRGCRLRRP